jgi:hypothetical protein
MAINRTLPLEERIKVTCAEPQPWWIRRQPDLGNTSCFQSGRHPAQADARRDGQEIDGAVHPLQVPETYRGFFERVPQGRRGDLLCRIRYRQAGSCGKRWSSRRRLSSGWPPNRASRGGSPFTLAAPSALSAAGQTRSRSEPSLSSSRLHPFSNPRLGHF